MNSTTSRFATLMGSASILTLTAVAAQAQTQTAQATPESVPEQVLVTGSLIRGAAAVGVPVTNLGPQDLTQTGNLNVGELFRTVPQFNVSLSSAGVSSGGSLARQVQVNLRGLDSAGNRSLMMIDGVRFPPQGEGTRVLDPSIIPALSLDRIDVLTDGASATYGSDAIVGVVNLILKRGFNGATTMLHYDQPDNQGQQVQASQLWGRTWEGGDITLTYEFTNTNPVKGGAHSNYTVNYTPWGLDNQIPIASSIPGTISTGAPSVRVGTACTNCWVVPHGTGQSFNSALNNGLGPLGASSAATINWSTLTGNPANFGVNEVDSPKLGWEYAAEQRNSFVITADQQLFPGVSLFGTGFVSNRRTSTVDPPFYSTTVTNDIQTFNVPTTNPYYPTGAPTNLRVSYDLGKEVPIRAPVKEVSYRAEGGLNFDDLPLNWSGQVYYSRSSENVQWSIDIVNDNAANVALGNSVPVAGVTYTKPASIPYLNLFCDATMFQCNSPATLAYIKGQRAQETYTIIDERGAHFDGPLVDVPGGQVKLAVGGLYESHDVTAWQGNNATAAPGAPFSALYDYPHWNIWAEFAQLNIPVFGDSFNFPLVRRFELEGSIRHDAYNGTLQGSTTNPKVAFNWLIDDTIGATVRGSWGSSFRFAGPGETSPVISDNSQGFNLPGLSQVALPCTSGLPTAGSAAADLIAGGFACGNVPGGILWGGGVHPELRTFTNASTGQIQTRQGGPFLAPEHGLNYNIGIELAPTIDLLKGLDLQATWYSVRIDGAINSNASLTQQTLSDPTQRFHFVLPSDLGCPVAANKNPTTCGPFETMALAAVNDINSPISPSQVSNIFWISDASRANQGFIRVEGVDYSASYDFDAGAWGAWNTGITGTYYLHNFSQTVNGGAIIDSFNQNISAAGGIAQNGVTTSARMVYRARLGWTDGTYSVTGFLNYRAHEYIVGGVPTNVNFQCTTAGGQTGGGTFPCAISNFSNLEPSFYTFDLSLGYMTGDRPANDYLKNLTVQLVFRNLLNRPSPFEYAPNTSNRNPSAYDNNIINTGRNIGITLVKNW